MPSRSDDPLLALHQDLLGRFKDELRGPRPDGPVFLLELALDTGKLEECRERSAEALGRTPLKPDTVHRYSDRYLPLLCVATEVGYKYQGSGREYWPVLGRELRAQTDQGLREGLSQLYEDLAPWSGVLRPDTPWARRFLRIAWPVTHAVLPKELHSPLLQALDACAARTRPRGELLEDMLRWSQERDRGFKRLVGFLTQREVASAVIEALVQGTLSSRHLSEHALRRIRDDVLSVQTSRQTLQRVTEALRGPRPAPASPARTQAPTERADCKLLVRDLEGTPSLWLRVPSSPTRARLTQNRPLRVLGMRRTVGVDVLARGGELLLEGLDLPTLYGQRARLLPDDAAKALAGADKELLQVLSELCADLHAPIVLAEHVGPAGAALQLTGRTFTPESVLWLLLRPGDAPEAPRALERRRLAGLELVRVDATQPAGRRWLREVHHLTEQQQPRVRRLGTPPRVGPGRWEEGLETGDVLLLHVEREGVLLERSALAPGLYQATLPPEGGTWSITLEPGTLTLKTPVVERGSPPPPPIRLHAPGAEEGLGALERGELALQIEADLPLAGLKVHLELRDPEGLVAEVEAGPLGPLPATVGPAAPVWEQLRAVVANTGRRAGLELRAEVGALALGCWALEGSAPAAQEGEDEVWWDRGPNASTLQVDQTAGAQVTEHHCLAEEPLVLREGPLPPDRAGLRIPVRGPGEVLGWLVLADGPRRRQLGEAPPAPCRPVRLLRRLSGEPGRGAGLRALVDASRRWGAAQPAHLLAEGPRREVARALESWVVEALCGPDWAAAERDQAALRTGSQRLAAALQRRGLARDTGWDDLLKSHSERLEEERARVLAPLLPRLSAWAARGPADPDQAPPEVTEVEHALNGAYRRMGAQLPTDREDPDVGLAADELREAILEAEGAARLPALLDLIHPSARAYAELGALSVGWGALAGLAPELRRWLDAREDRPRRWSEPEAQALLTLWLPTTREDPPTDALLTAALADRPAARAARYLALRWRQERLGDTSG